MAQQGYTRQSSGSIVTGATILAAHFNNEYNQLSSTFDNTTGHRHDASVTGGGASLVIASFTGLTNTTAGILGADGANGFTARTLTGTAGKITVTNGTGVSGNPTLTIDAAYVGQTSITTLGTITTGVWNGTAITTLGTVGTGVWNGTVITSTYGGTGVNNAGKTLTFSNNLTLAGIDATTITFQGTDTYVGRATTDTLTHKTFDTAGVGNILKINGTAISAVTGSGSIVLATSPTVTGLSTDYIALSGSAAPNVGLYNPTAFVIAVSSHNATAFTVTNPDASAVNYIQASGADTLFYPSLAATGSDINIGLNIQTKGTGGIYLETNSSTIQLLVSDTANAVNYLQATGSATGNKVTISAAGTDSTIGIQLSPKGAEYVYATTPPTTDSSTKVATTAYVQNNIKRKVGSTTRDISTASGTQAITGIGFKPSIVLLTVTVSGQSYFSQGETDGTNFRAMYSNSDGSTATKYDTTTAACIYLSVTAGNIYTATTSSLDSDGFTLSWTKTGTPTGTATVSYVCIM